MNELSDRRWWLACGLVLAAALIATVPTTGDIGLTWDEPAYRYSQQISVQWWQQWSQVRSWAAVRAQLDPETLLYYWPYARYGINFHPPLAGQLNLLTYELFGGFMKDIPARRMASVIEFCLTITILFGFLARRYGTWVGGVAAAALLLMPRVYADAHIAGTDTPGMLLWTAAALAFWKGLYEPNTRRWRVLVGIVLGLAFVEKMGAVLVAGPLLIWLLAARLPALLGRRTSRADWIDGFLTSLAMLVPLVLAYAEIRRLSGAFLAIQHAAGVPLQEISPARTNLFRDHPATNLPGGILLVPLAVWLVRRLLGRLFPSSPVWGPARPALEMWTSMLAFGPAVAWLGNPAWWRETLPRLAHYYAISTTRRGVLPDIQILYFGQTYEYSLPWHNAWVLMGFTVPAGILIAAAVGLLYGIRQIARHDGIPLFFLLHLSALPAARMFETPAHDGVRLFLPSFVFLAAFAGWGVVGLADSLAWLVRGRPVWFRVPLAALALGPAAWELAKVHPFELSYYNELIGGPRGAWHRGFELSYWYDALDGRALDDLNRKLPPHAAVKFASNQSAPSSLIEDLQALGKLRGDIRGDPGKVEMPYMWLLTHDSKATAFSRLLFDMSPWYARRPRQLNGLRVLTVADPVAVSRAWALWLLTDAPAQHPHPAPDPPRWVKSYAPGLARFWGEGVTKVAPRTVNDAVFAWARSQPDRLLAAARAIAEGRSQSADPDVRRLMAVLMSDKAWRRFTEELLRTRPEALEEAVRILIHRPEAVRTVLLRYPYTDEAEIGGFLDQDFEPRAG